MNLNFSMYITALLPNVNTIEQFIDIYVTLYNFLSLFTDVVSTKLLST